MLLIDSVAMPSKVKSCCNKVDVPDCLPTYPAQRLVNA